MTEKDVMLTIRIEESLRHDLKKMCDERGVVMAKVIRKLIMEEITKYEAWESKQRGAKNGRKN